MKVDPQGFPHALYYRPNGLNSLEAVLVHGYYDGAAWKVEDIAALKIRPGSYPKYAFALGPDGTPQCLVDTFTDLAPYGGTSATLTHFRKVEGRYVAASLASISSPSTSFDTFRLAVDSSSLYARNLFNFVSLLVDKKSGLLAIDWNDEIVKGAALTKDGDMIHPVLKS